MRLQIGKGIDNYVSKLENLEFAAPEAIRRAVYDGAKIVADQIKANIEALPVQETSFADHVNGIKSIQKLGLLYGFGITKPRNDNGYINVKTGFDGYNKLQSKKYPKGQPNVMIARTFEGGNSFTQKHPFVGPAIRKTKTAAEMKMAQVIDQETSKVMN